MKQPVNRAGSLRWTGVIFLLLIIAVLSEAVHDVAIEHLGIPFPTIVTQPSWLPYVGSVVRLVALVLFCRAAKPALDKHRTARAAIVVGLLVTALSEGLRVPVIDFFLAHGWVGRRWLFTLISYLPRVAIGLLQGIAAVAIARSVALRSTYRAILAAAVAGFLVRFAFVPLMDQVAVLLDTLVGVTRPEPLSQPPYGLGMLTIIYVTFLEPTVASFIVARMFFSTLPKRTTAEIGIFILLILGVTGRLTLFLVSSFWVQEPLGTAFLSTGQFLAEMAVMAALSGWLGFRAVIADERRSASAPASTQLPA